MNGISSIAKTRKISVGILLSSTLQWRKVIHNLVWMLERQPFDLYTISHIDVSETILDGLNDDDKKVITVKKQ
jgi:hypothetical protein